MKEVYFLTTIVSVSIGGQAECPDQGCWSHSGAFLAKSVRQGERNTLNKGDANAGFKAVGWVKFCFLLMVLLINNEIIDS